MLQMTQCLCVHEAERRSSLISEVRFVLKCNKLYKVFHITSHVFCNHSLVCLGPNTSVQLLAFSAN